MAQTPLHDVIYRLARGAEVEKHRQLGDVSYSRGRGRGYGLVLIMVTRGKINLVRFYLRFAGLRLVVDEESQDWDMATSTMHVRRGDDHTLTLAALL